MFGTSKLRLARPGFSGLVEEQIEGEESNKAIVTVCIYSFVIYYHKHPPAPFLALLFDILLVRNGKL